MIWEDYYNITPFGDFIEEVTTLLRRFLGVPEPAEPFSHLNKKENFKAMLGGLMKGNMV